MSGIIRGFMFKGLGDAGASLADGAIREEGRLREAQLRADERRERQEADLAYKRERDADRLAAGKGGSGGKGDGPFMAEVAEGSMAEEAMAGRMKMTVPELRQLRAAGKTGDLSAYSTETELAGPTPDGETPLKGSGVSGAAKAYVADKRAALAEIQQEFIYGKDYKGITDGREGAQKTSIIDSVMRGQTAAPKAAEAMAAGKGEGAFGKGNVNQFTGTPDAVGDSVIVENRAQAGKASAEAANARREGDGEVKPKDMIAAIDSQRKALAGDLLELRAAKKTAVDAEFSPEKKKAVIKAYEDREKAMQARKDDMDTQFDALRKRLELPGRGKSGENTGNVKAPKAPTIDAVKGAPAGAKIGGYDPAKGWAVLDSTGKKIGYVRN